MTQFDSFDSLQTNQRMNGPGRRARPPLPLPPMGQTDRQATESVHVNVRVDSERNKDTLSSRDPGDDEE